MEKINFYSGPGYKLRGYIYSPKTQGNKVPGIVCCHGWSGVLDASHEIAERLSEAGYVTLLIQHRGLGESEGPRGRMIPCEQAEDVRNAITYL